MHREDFNIFNNDVIYFDNGATTQKPKVLVESISDYYSNYTANAHRGDYDFSMKVDCNYENTREEVKKFINASSTKQIAFTSGTTDSINKIILGHYMNCLKKEDEVILSISEHASNILPWYELVDKIGIKIVFVKLDENLKVTLDNIKKAISNKTKVISLAHITNVVGDIRPIKEITAFAHEKNIEVLVDGAQSVAHLKTDVQDLDIDFLAFSAHKMCGPTGVGVLYAKDLTKVRPVIVGGGMNASFETDGTKVYNEVPHCLEAGTPNIAGVIGFGAVLKYLDNIGIDNIRRYETMLRSYALSKLKLIDNIIIYNEFSESGIISFNYKDIFSQDLAIYLNKFNICVRAGNHCAKILKDDLNIKNTCRISFYFYNNLEEIDILIDKLNNENIKDEII